VAKARVQNAAADEEFIIAARFAVFVQIAAWKSITRLLKS
jgi:hypothetical protein